MEIEAIKKLPQEVQDNLAKYLDRIKAIKWFQPAKEFDKKDAEQKVKFALDCFGVKAEIEWRKLEKVEDWNAAWDATWGAAWGAAWGAVWGAAWGAAWDAARDAAWDAARDAARDAVWGAAEIIVMDLKDFTSKYPNGAFINLIPLWELGLYPVGIIDKKFVIYIPPYKQEFPEIK